MTRNDLELANALIRDLDWVRDNDNFTLRVSVNNGRNFASRAKFTSALEERVGSIAGALLKQQRDEFESSIISQLKALGVTVEDVIPF